MVIKLTPQVHSRIADAIAAAEQKTAGEIFCVLARQVSAYRDISLGWAAAAALLLPLLVWLVAGTPPAGAEGGDVAERTPGSTPDGGASRVSVIARGSTG